MTRKELYSRLPYAYLTAPGARTWVYAIKCGEYIKIGIAKDVRRRLDEINLCNPYLATVVIQAEVAACLALKAERELHIHFMDHHHKREWFKLSAKDVRTKFWQTIRLADEVEEQYARLLDEYAKARENSVKRRAAAKQKQLEKQ